ncbi:MAG: alpha-L-fucosidase [Frondihabitans sp.]|nr:alpha-L-fucosidase [Frondihabitans sp.]
MAMFKVDSVRPAPYEKFARRSPRWFTEAKLGIFIHWGAYSVAAWAEPLGDMGSDDVPDSFARNPYAEWYMNTSRIEGSPAWKHHQEVFGGADYYDLLDLWMAERFDADDVLALIKHTGARYFVPTAKHHDGISLWSAPATGDLNTVERGPKRDLIREFAEATRKAGLKFGVYYSGGLDWHFAPAPPLVDKPEDLDEMFASRPVDDDYARYAFAHVNDLIEKFTPDVLWDDIDWPDAGKEPGDHSLVTLFERYYETVPDGMINDRWGDTHWDYRTTEYQMGAATGAAEPWENCRGVGYSFGYNQLEDETTTLSGEEVIRHFIDVVARGGNLLLNIGLKADGTVPDIQRRSLEALGDWNALHGDVMFGSVMADPDAARPSEEPWVRWTSTDAGTHAIVDAEGEVTLDADPARLDPASATLSDGAPVAARATRDAIVVTLPPRTAGTGPTVVSFTATATSR